VKGIKIKAALGPRNGEDRAETLKLFPVRGEGKARLDGGRGKDRNRPISLGGETVSGFSKNERDSTVKKIPFLPRNTAVLTTIETVRSFVVREDEFRETQSGIRRGNIRFRTQGSTLGNLDSKGHTGSRKTHQFE